MNQPPPGLRFMTVGTVPSAISGPVGLAGAGTSPAWAAGAPAAQESTTYEPFQLKPDFAGPCARAEVVDVNLGHSPESFVRAAHCQIAGEPAPPEVVERWVDRMRDAYYVRRIDVVRSLCAEHRRACKLAYSDPWVAQPDLGGPPQRRARRE